MMCRSSFKDMDIHDSSSKSGHSFSSYQSTEENHSLIPVAGQHDENDDEVIKENGKGTPLHAVYSFTDSSLNKENGKGSAMLKHDKSDVEGEVGHSTGTSDLWLPPEPEDAEDDTGLTVAINDEDDDYTDGTEWGQPNSISSLDDYNGCIFSDKEKQRKAMMEAMHAQFKFLVSRFLVSEGILSSGVEDEDIWVDIVTSLSWQAALLVKPDATEGRAMDPGFYVKVKCIACGSCAQSQVIKGLVFKKNTAHKHMPTSFKNAKLLLLKGILGDQASGLSSLSSMDQENDYVKSVIEIIESCHPNVVLIEKTAPRYAQESLLAKGITVVFDMKLPRLEKIARCTGSRIISSADITMNTDLKKCDFFHVEKFVEEHNYTIDGGKKSTKTLMFFEGCPKPLGCTILLKGAHSDELKKVKRVMQYTVFAAYHLILETSFYADQRAVSRETNSLKKHISENDFSGSDNMKTEVSSTEIFSEYTVEINGPYRFLESPRLQGLQSESFLDIEGMSANLRQPEGSCHFISSPKGCFKSHGDMHYDEVTEDEIAQPGTSHNLFTQLLPGQFLSSCEDSYKGKSNNMLLDVAYSYESLSSYNSFNGIEPISTDITASDNFDLLKINDGAKDSMSGPKERKMENGCAVMNFGSVQQVNESHNQVVAAGTNTFLPEKDNPTVILDTQSILVLFSSRCISKETVCEQNQLSRIKYYGNFDMSLGRFLQDVLLYQRHSCPICGEPSEAHVYGYTHQNGKLTVQVRQLPPQRHLSGEKDGKIWMWTHCLKCQHETGIPRSTKRVVMSTAARGLSFGKFLELSFSSHSATKMLAQCGHLLHRDCLRFFGFGSKVAMFRYSPVVIYTACQPPPVIELNRSFGEEWFEKEVKYVKHVGEEFFTEVTRLLEQMKPDFSRLPLSLPGSLKGISEVEDMLKQEKAEFEASLLIATKLQGHLGKSTPDLVNLRYLHQDLLLGIYVWEHRLNYLQSSKRSSDICGSSMEEETHISDEYTSRKNFGSAILADMPVEVQRDLEESTRSDSLLERNISNIEIESETCAGSSGFLSNEVPHVDDTVVESEGESFLDTPDIIRSNLFQVHGGESDTVPDLNDINVSSISLPFSLDSGCLKHGDGNADLDVKNESLKCNDDFQAGIVGDGQDQLVRADSLGPVSPCASATKASGPEDWIWLCFPDIHKIFLREHHDVYAKKFEDISCPKLKYMESLNQKITLEEGEYLHSPLGSERISIHDEEISSIVACALTKLQDQQGLLEIPETGPMLDGERGSGSTSVSPSSSGSLNPETFHTYQGQSFSDELSSSGLDSSFENMSSLGNLHLSISLADEKTTVKCKYTVVCIYAKEFYMLRRRCCSSELGYILSLSRCRKWDAQGGKSKALFAKTLDDRFIIKEIKKTELDSFLKFGPEYFKHILLSLSSGSQTCLAKIFGIYQVKQIKGGKETKHDLMVMENLLYGRDVVRTYDLKGAVHARYISDPNKPEKVLLDQNFVEDMGLSPMYIGGKTKHLLQRAIWNDTSFLTAINVMDYSLLVGVDEKRHELIFGIIDYLRQYTWDKQLETWVKSSLAPKNSLPTVISPKEYKKRFRNFMSKYFLTVPDSWTTESCADNSKSCSDS